MLKLKLIINIVTNILLACYPIVIFITLDYGYINLAILFLMMIFILKLFWLPVSISPIRSSQMCWFAKVVPCVGLFLVIISWVFSKYQLLLYYPVMVNLVLFIVFSHSLKQPPTIIERFARIQHPDLPEKAIQYTRKVTICWCLFFIVNGSIALTTCLLGHLDWWTLYNGGISYILILILMGIEWLVRKKHQN